MDSLTAQNFNIKYSEMEHNLALKPYSLLNFLQDVASENADNYGFGFSFTSKNNYAWFLIKYRIEFEDYPVNAKNLTFTTRPRGYNKLFAYREFEILQENKVLGRVFSVWSLVNLVSRTPVLISNVLSGNPRMTPYEKKETDLSFTKIKPIENISYKKEFEVRYNDLDVNGHANNGNYIVWAFEPLDFEFRTNHKIKTLDILFKKEAKFGEKIVVEVGYKDDLTTIHTLKNLQGEDLCLIEGNWTKFCQLN